MTTYAIQADGSLTDPKSQSDGQTALCWITPARGFYYVANTASNTLSGYTIAADGQPSLVGTTGIVATTEPGPIDLAASSDGAYLYVLLSATGQIASFEIGGSSLKPLNVVSGLPLSLQGIVAR